MCALPASAAPPARAQDRPGDSDTASAPSALFTLWSAIPGRIAQLVAERAGAEVACHSSFAARTKRAEEELRASRLTTERRKATETTETDTLVASLRQAANRDFEAESQVLQAERDTLRRTANTRFKKRQHDALSNFEATKWEVSAIFETAERGTKDWRKESLDKLAGDTGTIEELRADLDHLLASYRGFVAKSPPKIEAAANETSSEPLADLDRGIQELSALLARLQSLRLPRAFHGIGALWLFLLPTMALGYPAYLALGVKYGAIASVVAGAFTGFLLRQWIVAISRGPIEDARRSYMELTARTSVLLPTCEAHIREVYEARHKAAEGRRDEELARSVAKRDEIVASATSERLAKIEAADETASRRLTNATQLRDRALTQADETEARRRREITSQYEADIAKSESRHTEAIHQAETRHRDEWNALAEAWSTGMAAVAADAKQLSEAFEASRPENLLAKWAPAARMPESIPFGTYDIGLDRFPEGISQDETLRSLAPLTFHLPALLDFPSRSSLVMEFPGEEARQKTVDAMQAVMLRLLTILPPGKVRFTILDPVGLGRNFAAFMHLADYGEAMVNTRIWTEPQDIDHRLAELNTHIETVIQNYLRNEFPTIEAYNEQAAEVAEPYRVLVIADFPAGFSEATARRLAAIAKSGPRCGVYLILGLDTSQPLPPSIVKSDLTKLAARVSSKGDRHILRDPSYEPFALKLDEPPPSEDMSRLLRKIGEAARDASRVEVPFEVIAPKQEDYWKGDSRSELSIPLGRAGATKLQPLKLGRGTSQHVLIAGRTGSGKSTLLHALITNAALIYGPDEIELYLIDFKKGVEFKTYATHGLPHARVIAIESEREFGVSVLQRLDAILKARGDLFRDVGVQDVAGFRAARPDTPMPRVLLIVDEFQEFFVEDDKLSQETALLLDRLVRQGRAFGVHVHLGSQTLGGAYALARSTLGQMAIRIALQCSESDAHLILNEDNSAARLLSRPGEAIYNDANGQVEGNHVFQVVFLTDSRREAYIKHLAQLARDKGLEVAPQIVFEGNHPADVTKLPSLSSERRPKTGPVLAWVGDAIAIKDPTAATFRAQGGSNLLMIGQNEELAVGVMSAMILGLASQLPDASRFFLLDGSPEDSPFSGRIARVMGVVPQTVAIGGLRDSATILTPIAEEVERRQSNAGDASPWFLIIHDLARFRDLRKQEDDYGSSRRGEPKAVHPSKLLATILRDGAMLGIHCIIWCDTSNNLNRAFDRQSLREFEMRVLFQMSATDSSNLIDTPAASRLGANRGLFAGEDSAVLEKFRPYGPPEEAWMDALASRWKPVGVDGKAEAEVV